MPRSLTISAASGVSFAFSAMRNTAPCSRPRTSSSVMTSFADSSRVTVERGDAGEVNEVGILEGEASDSAGIALLKTSRTRARTRSLVASSAMDSKCHFLHLLSLWERQRMFSVELHQRFVTQIQ